MNTARRVSLTVFGSVLIVSWLVLPALAQGNGHGGGSGGMGHGYHDGGYLYFDPDSLVTLAGELTLAAGEWDPWGHGNHTGGGMAFEFLGDDAVEYELMLAPAWFLEDAGIVLATGERVTVTASLVESYDGGAHHHGGGAGGHHGGHGGPGRDDDYLIVTVLEADGVRLELRDDEGYPLWRGGPGWNDHWFDPDSVATYTGTFTEWYGMWSVWGYGNHTGNGMHLGFAADDGNTYMAMLGPWWYLERKGIELEEGQAATIRGSVVEPYWAGHQGDDYLIATEITVGGVTVRLRDDWGYPLWQGTGWGYFCPSWTEGQPVDMTGEVVRVRRRRNGRQLDLGYELMIRAGGRRYRLFVAPDWHVRQLGMSLARGNTIRFQGMLSEGTRLQEVVVRRIQGPGGTWRFRTRNGTPLWILGSR